MEEEIIKRLLGTKDSIKIKVRFNDTDAMGVVHFKNYLVYMDDGFVSFMRDVENPVEKAVIQKGIVFPVKKINILYENSATFGDFIIVETRIKEIKEHSITFFHDIYRESDKAILAKVESVRLIMKLKTKKILNARKFLVKIV